MSRLVFLDTETTGLNPARHEVWEVAWAEGDGPISTLHLSHSLASADPEALELNGYHDRVAPAYYDADLALRGVLDGATLVCSNPSFDTSFLRARWGVEPWHHRKVDIATYAMPALRADRPVGLAKLAEHFNVKAPDHTAAGDVAVMRECYRRLTDIYAAVFGEAP